MMKRYLSILLVLLTYFRLSAQEWVVPAENSTKLSPLAFSDSTRKSGADLYNLNCKSCHGDPGKNNAILGLVPLPPDPASAKMQSNSDGALNFKITQGRTPMPSFKNILSATDVWRVISYIRSYNDKYVQEIEKKTGGAEATANVKILMTWLKEKNQIQAAISATKLNLKQPVAGAEVKLFAKRYFGNLLIDEARNTDAQGKVLFNFPMDLPGDSAGLVQLIAKLSDETAYGEAKFDTTLAIGVPTYRPPLNEQRAMWNVVQKTPIWLLLAYTFTVLAVWGFIFYVLLQIRAIYMAGKNKEHKTLE